MAEAERAHRHVPGKLNRHSPNPRTAEGRHGDLRYSMSDLPPAPEPPWISARRRTHLIADYGTLGVAATGATLVVLGATLPWSQLGGSLLWPSTCLFPSVVFGPISALFAMLAMAGVVSRRARMITLGGVFAMIAVLVGLGEVGLCSDCVCTPRTSYRGPAYGWAISLAGTAIAFSGGVATWLLTKRLTPRQ